MPRTCSPALAAFAVGASVAAAFGALFALVAYVYDRLQRHGQG